MSHIGPDGRSESSSSRRLSSADSTAVGSVVSTGKGQKLCCVCGENLSGKQRFKDHEGRYWCPPCAKADDERKQPAACAECNQGMTRGDLEPFEGRLVCKPCLEKLHQAAKRAAARIKAAEEEARKQHEHRRLAAIIAVTVLAILVVFGAVYWLVM